MMKELYPNNNFPQKPKMPKYAPIQLCLFQKHHYISNHDTGIKEYALENYSAIKHKCQWWRFVSSDRRAKAGMSGCELLNYLHQNALCTRIDEVSEELMKAMACSTVRTNSNTFLSIPVFGNSELKASVGTTPLIRSMQDRPQGVSDGMMRALLQKRSELSRFEVDPRLLRCAEEIIMTRRPNAQGQLKVYNSFKDIQKNPLVFYDFETATNNGGTEEGDTVHVPYMCSFKDALSEEVTTKHGPHCCQDMIMELAHMYKNKARMVTINKQEVLCIDITMIAHNHNYDLSFVLKHLHKLKITEKGTNKYAASGQQKVFLDGGYAVVRFKFMDSYKMIADKLSNFSKTFNLPAVKEDIPYSLYTYDFVNTNMTIDCERLVEVCRKEKLNDHIPCEREWYKELEKKADKFAETVIENAKRWGLVKDGIVDMKEYSKRYCEQDVRVLADGYIKYRDFFFEVFGIDTLDSLTISSISAKVVQPGAFDNYLHLNNLS